MGKMKEMQLTIEEVARVALESEEIRSYIGDTLDISDEYLQEVWEYLHGRLTNLDTEKSRALAARVFGFAGGER